MNIFKEVGNFFFGDGKTAEKVTEMADEAFYTKQEEAKDVSDDLASARAYEPGVKFNTFIDQWHRAIRPAIATWATLVLFGVIPPPSHWASIPEPVWQIILLVISFYFGGRALLKDLPSAIRAMRSR